MPPSPSPGRFRQADAIFDAALDLEGDERMAFVDRACEGNAELLATVRRLLRAFERSGAFLSGPAVDVARPLLDAAALAGDEEEDATAPPPAHVGPYRILRTLGRGGMGVVYLATREDDPAEVLVALKTLRAGALASGPVLRRFLAERQILATLEHPHAARLLETGITTAGTPYFAMVYCAGGSLAERLVERPLSVPDALRVARQLAEALTAAHAVGIIHRDIKPANVLFNPAGDVQLTDFGIAKLQDHDTTQSGLLMGTPAYLAPEQLRGVAIDPRADLWSLGVTLYEMLTGRRPFDGPSYAAVLHAVLTVEPDPVGRTSPVPPSVDALLKHLLSREPDARPSTAAEVALALAAIEADPTAPYIGASARPPDPTPTPSRATRTNSIVVLPFANSSRDAEDDPLTDGLTDELIGALGKLRGLRVIARTTAFALKRKGLDAQTIAKVIGVAYVLEGRVRRAGPRLRISAQLVSTDDATVAWSETYDRELGDIFSLQEELAGAIVAALAPTLGPAELATVTPERRDVATYELYLKGRYFWQRRMAPDLLRAAEYFAHATARDPSYAEAYAGLADAHMVLVMLCGRPPGESLPVARSAVAEALRLGTGRPMIHATNGHLLSGFEWQWADAESELRHAIDLDPGIIDARVYLASMLQHVGRFEEAIAVATEALLLDPLSPAVNLHLGRAHLHAGRPAEALRPLRTAVEIAPGFPVSLHQLGHAFLQLGRGEEALEAFRNAAATGGQIEAGLLAYAHAATGDRATATTIVDELLGGDPDAYLPPFGIACAYAGLGNVDAAFQWLARGVEERAAQIATLKVAPPFASLRRDPRFAALLGRMNLGPEAS